MSVTRASSVRFEARLPAARRTGGPAELGHEIGVQPSFGGDDFRNAGLGGRVEKAQHRAPVLFDIARLKSVVVVAGGEKFGELRIAGEHFSDAPSFDLGGLRGLLLRCFLIVGLLLGRLAGVGERLDRGVDGFRVGGVGASQVFELPQEGFLVDLVAVEELFPLPEIAPQQGRDALGFASRGSRSG